MIIVERFFIRNCTTVYNYTLKLRWFNSFHFDEEQKQNFMKSMYVTISKQFKTVDKQVKSNSSIQLFFEFLDFLIKELQVMFTHEILHMEIKYLHCSK